MIHDTRYSGISLSGNIVASLDIDTPAAPNRAN